MNRAKQQKIYRDFLAIKDENDALRFWTTRVTTPVGKYYFTPMDYQWDTTDLRAELCQSHARRWNSLRGLFQTSERQKSNEEFEDIETLLVRTIVSATDHLGEWVKSRYDIGQTYLIPDEFSDIEYLEIDNTLSLIEEDEENEMDSDYKVLYYWQEVEPDNEPANDGRRHCILLDRVTHQEAPLLPGQEPFPR